MPKIFLSIFTLFFTLTFAFPQNKEGYEYSTLDNDGSIQHIKGYRIYTDIVEADLDTGNELKQFNGQNIKVFIEYGSWLYKRKFDDPYSGFGTIQIFLIPGDNPLTYNFKNVYINNSGIFSFYDKNGELFAFYNTYDDTARFILLNYYKRSKLIITGNKK